MLACYACKYINFATSDKASTRQRIKVSVMHAKYRNNCPLVQSFFNVRTVSVYMKKKS